MKHSTTKLNDSTSNKILLFVIIGIAIVLRCWDYFDLPYITYDEFGVIFSTRLKTFNELLTMRIMPDGHPAGMSVFSFYWIKLVGINAWWVKLSFIIFIFLNQISGYGFIFHLSCHTSTLTIKT